MEKFLWTVVFNFDKIDVNNISIGNKHRPHHTMTMKML